MFLVQYRYKYILYVCLLGIVDFDFVNFNGIRNIKELELNVLLQKNYYFVKFFWEIINNYFIDVFGVVVLLYDG